jgi:UDP:flavonoid glycosyltransferase YjiC (YdhE family)
MKVLFASSGVGLGHIVRDLHLSKHMHWADITWLTSGTALRYLEAKGVKIHEASYAMEGLNKLIEDVFEEGRLKIGPKKVLKLYNVVKGNAKKLKELVDLDHFDGIIADEFWELLLMERSKARIAFITDFINFKPQKGSILQNILIPYVNRALHKNLNEFNARIYVGLGPITDEEFEFYGQLFTHEGDFELLGEEFVLINLGGTFAGKILLNKALPLLKRLGFKTKVIGPSEYFIPNPLSYIASSKLVISMAGYSSLIELSRFRKRGIIVPLGGDFEHMDNAEAFKDRPGYRIIPCDRLHEGLLARAIKEVLGEEPTPPEFKDGAERISERLKKLLEG